MMNCTFGRAGAYRRYQHEQEARLDPKPPVISVGFAVPQQVIGSIRLETPNRYLARKPNFVEYSA
jgi:hypothetical protein